MPSPVGHFLGGMIGGLLVSRQSSGGLGQPSALSRQPGCERRAPWWPLVTFGLLGVAPDLDFLFGTHGTYTHSVGAMVLVGVAATALSRPAAFGWGAACVSAYGSHILLDWLSTDTVPPIGIMALWPFGEQHYLAGLQWFMAIQRDGKLAAMLIHDALAVLRELLILGPVAAAAVWWACRKRL